MAEVKWIKIVTDVFDDEKILMIESMPEADGIIVIWFKLLCLAGKQNNSGVFQMGRMPYTDEMFSTIFRRPLNTIRLALKTFEQFGMIEILNNTVTIPNWDKHQSLDMLEKKKQRDRQYHRERRAAQKALAENLGEMSYDMSIDASSDVASQSRSDKKEKRLEGDVDVDEDDSETAATQINRLGGDLGKGVVFLSDRQMECLLERMGLYAFERYVERLAGFIINKNANVKNHYGTILKWYEEDSKV